MAAKLSEEQTDFLKAASRLMKGHVDLKEFSRKGFSQILGSSSANATIYFLGDAAFADPMILLVKLEGLFHGGTAVLLAQLVDMAEEGTN